MEQIIQDIRADLIQAADEKTKESSQRFFKEAILCYGVANPVANRIGKDYFGKLKTATKPEIFKLCEQLWQSRYMEEAIIACNWSYFVHKQYEPQDMSLFEKWIQNYVTNWATCDTLCNHTVGTCVEMFPGLIHKLKEFATSDNRWMKRAAAVSVIIPARKGMFLNDIFQIAETLLQDKDDMVQKGYGWMLKAASEAHQDEVFGFVMNRKQVMPRTSLRYAIEKMPKELKAQAMAK